MRARGFFHLPYVEVDVIGQVVVVVVVRLPVVVVRVDAIIAGYRASRSRVASLRAVRV